MIVYGDHKRNESSRQLRADAIEMIDRLGPMPAGIDRHSALVGLFVEISALIQALADVEFEANGMDINSPRQQRGATILVALAADVARSWASSFALSTVDPKLRTMLEALDCHEMVLTGTAEGYAHYALYPESYLAAAQASGLEANTCVIGIRSIGLGLAAMVAAALGAPAPASLRPVGHPFRRHVKADPGLISLWKNNAAARFAIVDEGPGLSGSSMHAVIAWLHDLGVDHDRIHLFPSHSGGPGSEASDEIRRIWFQCRQHPAAEFGSTFRGGSHGSPLRKWVADALVGGPDLTLTDISGGQWRQIRGLDEGLWPPSHRAAERRKFLARATNGRWLVKFAGLGRIGQRKAQTARMLHRAGFGPQVAAFCHGFLVEQWIDGATLDQASLSKNRLVTEIARYLAWRATNLPTSEPGAPLSALAAMAVHNASQAFGESTATDLANWFSINTPAQDLPRVEIDGRLHAWEFLVCANAELVKTDAVDHCRAHDLIGCQPIEWDIAGACVEHGLSRHLLMRRVQALIDRAIDPCLVDYFRVCYMAFQLGLWTMAAQPEHGPEKTRLTNMANRYRTALELILAGLG